MDALLTDLWLTGHHKVAEDLCLPNDLLPEEEKLAVVSSCMIFLSYYWPTMFPVSAGSLVLLQHCEGWSTRKGPQLFRFEKGSGDKTPVDIINKNKALYAALIAKKFAWAHTVSLPLPMMHSANLTIRIHITPRSLAQCSTIQLSKPWSTLCYSCPVNLYPHFLSLAHVIIQTLLTTVFLCACYANSIIY